MVAAFEAEQCHGLVVEKLGDVLKGVRAFAGLEQRGEPVLAARVPGPQRCPVVLRVAQCREVQVAIPWASRVAANRFFDRPGLRDKGVTRTSTRPATSWSCSEATGSSTSRPSYPTLTTGLATPPAPTRVARVASPPGSLP